MKKTLSTISILLICITYTKVHGLELNTVYGARLQGFSLLNDSTGTVIGNDKTAYIGFGPAYLGYSLFNQGIVGTPYHRISLGTKFSISKFYVDLCLAILMDKDFNGVPPVIGFASYSSSLALLDDMGLSLGLGVEYPLLKIPTNGKFEHVIAVRGETHPTSFTASIGLTYFKGVKADSMDKLLAKLTHTSPEKEKTDWRELYQGPRDSLIQSNESFGCFYEVSPSINEEEPVELPEVEKFTELTVIERDHSKERNAAIKLVKDLLTDLESEYPTFSGQCLLNYGNLNLVPYPIVRWKIVNVYPMFVTKWDMDDMIAVYEKLVDANPLVRRTPLLDAKEKYEWGLYLKVMTVYSIACENGFYIRDLIRRCNGVETHTPSDFYEGFENTWGYGGNLQDSVKIEFIRDNQPMEIWIEPVYGLNLAGDYFYGSPLFTADKNILVPLETYSQPLHPEITKKFNELTSNLLGRYPYGENGYLTWSLGYMKVEDLPPHSTLIQYTQAVKVEIEYTVGGILRHEDCMFKIYKIDLTSPTDDTKGMWQIYGINDRMY
ncbi:MAG: hypothetical protein E3J71_10465 [Candidatus Stahlbacteria bacterium]|nr:MAG: hypothetical protein E3J71_10465 [Candidatus Stahlbacteria bacterium]